MGIAQAVKQVASDVVDTAKSATAASAKQIAKTPLDLLEELLGQTPAGDKKPESPESSENTQGSAAGVNPEELKQKEIADQQYKTQRTEQLHQQIQASSQSYYEQKKAMDEQKKQAAEQAKEQKKFQIENLEKQKKEDYALKAAQDASSAEKRVGAG